MSSICTTGLIALLIVLHLGGMSAFASIEALNQKKDELELEQEVESMERFGTDAFAEETRRESDRLTRETKQLEREIMAMKQAHLRANDKTKRLAALYQQKAQLAARVQKQASKAETQKVKSEKVVTRLEEKVKNKELAALAAIEERKAAESRIVELQKQEQRLKMRLKSAQNVINRNEVKKKSLRAKSMRLSNSIYQLENSVRTLEARARRS